MTTERGTWGSRFAFILAAAGSAVGLGNVWGFPTRVGQSGGAAFVLVYLASVLFICTPILIAEIALGRGSGSSPVGAFERFRPKSAWWLFGGLGVVSGVGIVSYYSVIGGWTIAYVGYALFGQLSTDPSTLGQFFSSFTARGGLNVWLTVLFIAFAAGSNFAGVRQGIERVTKILMPLLIGLLILLAVRALTLPGAYEGVDYYLKPDFGKALHLGVFSAALGQAFFSLSLGNGGMLTYGSYLSRKESIGRAVLWVVAIDTGIALLAGLIVFSAGFSIPGFDPASGGPGLLFTVLPRLFATLPAGGLFGAAFFFLLLLAALTSAIALLEIPVAHCIDQYGWPRKKSVLAIASAAALFSIPSALSNGAVDWLGNVTSPAWGPNFLGLAATLWNNFALPIGGLGIALFVGWIWGSPAAVAELTAEGSSFPMPKLWAFIVRYIAPVAIVAILLTSIWPLFF